MCRYCLRFLFLIVLLGYLQASCVYALPKTSSFSLKEAVQEANLAKFNLCLAQGKDIKVVDVDGSTLLHWACASYTAEKNLEDCRGIVQELLRRDIDMLNKRNDDGWTPLHWAVERGFNDGVELLLKAKADTNIQDNQRFIPLHYALRRYNTSARNSMYSIIVQLHQAGRAH